MKKDTLPPLKTVDCARCGKKRLTVAIRVTRLGQEEHYCFGCLNECIELDKLRKWIEKELTIEIPVDVDQESYIKGFVAGVQDERKRVRQELRKVA